MAWRIGQSGSSEPDRPQSLLGSLSMASPGIRSILTGIHSYEEADPTHDSTPRSRCSPRAGPVEKRRFQPGRQSALWVTAVTATGIGYIARYYKGGSIYVLSANSVSQDVPATFEVTGLPAGQTIQVLFENRSLQGLRGRRLYRHLRRSSPARLRGERATGS